MSHAIIFKVVCDMCSCIRQVAKDRFSTNDTSQKSVIGPIPGPEWNESFLKCLIAVSAWYEK